MGAELLHALERATEVVQGARNQPRQLERLFARSPVPLVLMDESRRFRHANTAACMTLRLGLGDLLSRCAHDIVLPFAMTTFETAWTEMRDAGLVRACGFLKHARMVDPARGCAHRRQRCSKMV